jgi:hypothetical protein
MKKLKKLFAFLTFGALTPQSSPSAKSQENVNQIAKSKIGF